MKSIVKKLKSRAGFTLVELVVVIAVLAILAGVGSVAYKGYIDRANEAKTMEYLSAVKTAVDAATAERDTTVTTITVTKDGTVVVPTNGTDSSGMSEDEKSLYTTFMSDNPNPITGSETWTWSASEWTKS